MDSISDSKNNDTGGAFFSKHALVFVCSSHNPKPEIREIAYQVRSAERMVQRVLGGRIESVITSLKSRVGKNVIQ